MHHHHVRRRSGHSSATDVRRVPSEHNISPRHRKSSSKDIRMLGKSTRERERQISDDDWNSHEPESFPQFCMSCEKQFFDVNERELYCSEECRSIDEVSSPRQSRYIEVDTRRLSNPMYPPPEPPRDIIPRASPSRPDGGWMRDLSSVPTSPYADGPTSPRFSFGGIHDRFGSRSMSAYNHASTANPSMTSMSMGYQSEYPSRHRNGISSLRSPTIGMPTPPNTSGVQANGTFMYGSANVGLGDYDRNGRRVDRHYSAGDRLDMMR